MVASKLLAEARQVAEVEEVASKLLAEKGSAICFTPLPNVLRMRNHSECGGHARPMSSSGLDGA